MVCSCSWQTQPCRDHCRPRTVGGDTLEINGNLVRLLNIDAPDSGQTCWILGLVDDNEYGAAGRSWPHRCNLKVGSIRVKSYAERLCQPLIASI